LKPTNALKFNAKATPSVSPEGDILSFIEGTYFLFV
jgi:hypothetical protein